jgi:hypothetical protein
VEHTTVAEVTITIDPAGGEPPDTTLRGGPRGATESTSATFSFSSGTSGASFECRLDTGPWRACSSPHTLEGVLDGDRVFAVRAVDGEAREDRTPAERRWTVDTTPPSPTISRIGMVRWDTTPLVVGAAGDELRDEREVTLSVFDERGIEVRRLSGSARQRRWGVEVTPALPPGRYRMRVAQADTLGNRGESADVETTIEATPPPPQASFTDGPPRVTEQRQATITWTFDRRPARVTCVVDTNWSYPCDDNRITVDRGDEGPHSVVVRAFDADGRESQARYEWRVDRLAPHVTAGRVLTSDTTPRLAGGAGQRIGDEPSVEVTVETMDGRFLERMTAPVDSEGKWVTEVRQPLAQGNYRFVTRQRDDAGHVGQYTEYIEITAPPETRFRTAPQALSRYDWANFWWESTSNRASFQCRLDGAAWEACSTSRIITGLSEGPHVFEVKSVLHDGAEEPEPARHEWRVDTRPPVVTVDEPADGSRTYDATPRLSGRGGIAEGDDPTLIVEVSTASGMGLRWFEPEVGPDGRWSAEVTQPLPPGSYRVQAIQYDWTRNWTETEFNDFVILPEPTTWFVSSPAPEQAHGASVRFEFTSNTAGATFECRIDEGAWRACTSPHEEPGPDLGGHLFEVRARNAEGGFDSTPEQYRFTVEDRDPPPPVEDPPAEEPPPLGDPPTEVLAEPQTTIETGPPEVGAESTARFTFVADQTGTRFECRLDDAAWRVCASPHDETGLPAGAHVFEARAIVGEDTADSTPAQWRFVVGGDDAPPADDPPADDPRPDDPPGEDPPADDPPADDPPAGDPPSDDPPAGDPPAGDPPADDPPAGDPPSDDPPAGDPPADDPPADDPPADDPPSSEPPADDPPAGEPPADDPPAGDPPADDPPVGAGDGVTADAPRAAAPGGGSPPAPPPAPPAGPASPVGPATAPPPSWIPAPRAADATPIRISGSARRVARALAKLLGRDGLASLRLLDRVAVRAARAGKVVVEVRSGRTVVARGSRRARRGGQVRIALRPVARAAVADQEPLEIVVRLGGKVLAKQRVALARH